MYLTASLRIVFIRALNGLASSLVDLATRVQSSFSLLEQALQLRELAEMSRAAY